MADLGGRVVAFLEGRREKELADLIRRHNGVPLAAPCLREVHSPEAVSLQIGVWTACTAKFDIAVFLTGVGTRTVFDAAAHGGLEAVLRERLEAALVVARGPKPSAVLRQLDVRIDVGDVSTSAEILQALRDVDMKGKRVLVQLYGGPNPELSQALTARGAHVVELAPYVWERPIDPAPVHALLDALDGNDVDALLITSQQQVEHLFAIAHEHGREPQLQRVAIGAQGPVAEAALNKYGYASTFTPEHGHMGALVLAAARYFTREGVTK